MQHPPRRRSLSKALAATALAGVTAVSVTLGAPVAYADPVPPAPAPTPAPAPAGAAVPAAAPAPAPAAVDPNAPAPSPADPNAPAPDPNVPPPPPPEPGRVNNSAGGFSYVVPAGWKVSDNTQLSYGQALLTKIPDAGAQPPTDTSVLLGRLDLKLFAGSESDNSKAAIRLASDMGEFFMPFAGTRQDQAAGPLDAAGMPGAFSSYDVKFTDTTKPDGQIWAGVVGQADPDTTRQRNPQRWFVVWLGSAGHPVDKAAATTLAQSIRPFTPPPPPPPPDPDAPPDPNAPPAPPAPPGRPAIGVPVPVTDAPPGMMPGG